MSKNRWGKINYQHSWAKIIMAQNGNFLFFFDKNKTLFIHSNWLSTSDTNTAKNVKGESANKLTTLKLIAYNGKMPTNNMIKFKSLKYPCFQICNVDAKIINWICNWLMPIFQYELNEHRDKTQNQTSHKTTNNKTPHLNDEITKNTKGKSWYMWKPLI
jgi:hypothetical protein